MADTNERRFNERVKIDGAHICYRCTKEKSLFGRFSDPTPIEDIRIFEIR